MLQRNEDLEKLSCLNNTNCVDVDAITYLTKDCISNASNIFTCYIHPCVTAQCIVQHLNMYGLTYNKPCYIDPCSKNHLKM